MRTLFNATFATATLANLCFFTSVTTFFIMPVHLEQLGASPAQIGRIMGAFGVTSVLAIPITGVLVDRWGRRLFMVGGGLLWAVLAWIYSGVTAIGWLPYAVRLGQGVAFAMTFVATNALIADLAPTGALGRAIAVFGTTTLVTHALGPSVGELIAKQAGFRVLYQCSAVVAGLAVVAYLVLREPAREPVSRGASPATGLLRLATRRGAKGTLAAGVTSALAFGSAMLFMPTFVRSRGIETHVPFFTAYVLAAVAVRLFAGGIGDRFGYRRVGAFALLVFSITVACFASVHSVTSLMLFALVFGLTHGWAYPSLNALFVQGAPPAARGRAMALFTLAFNVGITTAAFASGEVAERWGYSTMWLTVAAIGFVGVGALLVGAPTWQRGQAAEPPA